MLSAISHLSAALRSPAALALLAGCLLAYGLTLLGGASAWDAAPADLLRAGANYAPAIAYGEWWRLVSAIFLHGGALHLVLNLLALAEFAPEVERRRGTARTLLLFLICGASGSLASAALHSGAVSVGASGAIFGLFGDWLVAAGRNRQEPGPHFRRRLLLLAGYALLALGSGFLLEGVDNAAHLGGFACGVLLSLLGGGLRGTDEALSRRFVSGVALMALAIGVAATSFPADWAVPYAEGRRFDSIYREFVQADRRISDSLRRLGHEAQAGRIGEAEALKRLDSEIVPSLHAAHRGWRDESFAAARVEAERRIWVDYTRLRLEAVSALRDGIARGDRGMVRRFEAKMAAAAALVDSVRARRAPE